MGGLVRSIAALRCIWIRARRGAANIPHNVMVGCSCTGDVPQGEGERSSESQGPLLGLTWPAASSSAATSHRLPPSCVSRCCSVAEPAGLTRETAGQYCSVAFGCAEWLAKMATERGRPNGEFSQLPSMPASAAPPTAPPLTGPWSMCRGQRRDLQSGSHCVSCARVHGVVPPLSGPPSLPV
eukprot:6221336-Prymnesium_polylepis.1